MLMRATPIALILSAISLPCAYAQVPKERSAPVDEAELARSAAPPHIADSADVFVLGRTGFEKVAEGPNGFACLVERPRVEFSWPVCYDPEGARTLLHVALLRGRLRAAGFDEAAVADSVAYGFETGRLRPAAGTGIAYMLSKHAYSYDTRGDSAVVLDPHLMFYGPYLTNEQIGGMRGEDLDVRFPVVRGAGRPDAYVIVMLPGFDTGR